MLMLPTVTVHQPGTLAFRGYTDRWFLGMRMVRFQGFDLWYLRHS